MHTFAVNWDYRCPFARNAHEHLLAGLEAGAQWDITFLPFSLGQVHLDDGAPSVWEKPEQDSGILALQAGTLVRDLFPEAFAGVHRDLFAARHDEGLPIKDPAVVTAVLERHRVDAAKVMAGIEDGSALATIRATHEGFTKSHATFGVPTFIQGDKAVFVRLMHRSDPADPAESIPSIERVLALLEGFDELNEYKHTTLPR